MKYKVGDIIKTIDHFETEIDQLDIEQFLYKEFYMNLVGIILKINKAEQLYTILFAGQEKKAYIKEYMIKEKIETEQTTRENL
jgi:hypothetical protein